MRALGLLLPVLFFFLAACSGGGGSTGEQAVGAPGAPGVPVGPGGNPNPPAPPPGAPPFVADATFLDLGKAGAFPSDLAADGRGSLYTVDDAAIPANVLQYPASGGKRSVPLTASHLIDFDGTRPAAAPSAFDFAGGLFGAFTGDLEVAFERWLLVTVGAGNSASTYQGRELRLANLVLIDMQAGAVVQTIDLAWTVARSGQQSTGNPIPFIPQSLPSQVLFVPSDTAPLRGRVYVAMSNGAGDSNGLTLWYPGTVQVWNVDFSRPQPLAPDLQGRDPLHSTRTFVSNHFNPVGLTRYRNAVDVDYLLLTNAGASRFDASFIAIPESDAILEVLDLSTRQWQPALETDLGPILPAAQRMPLGRDGTGRPFGVLSSQTFAAAYVVGLGGLEQRPPDPQGLGLLRTIELAPDGSTTAGSGFHPGIGLTASSRTMIVSSFLPAALRVVALPEDVANGAIEVDPAPLSGITFDPSGGLGALVVPRHNVSDVYALSNGTFDPATFTPKDPAHVVSFTARDGLR